MQKIEEMSARQLYRGILQAVRTYPSKNRLEMRQAIIEDINEWKQVKGDSE